MATLGTCPVCERSIRVRAGKMVHHGYARPGRGRIVGDCYGVGLTPYEVSSEGTELYRDRVVVPGYEGAESFLAGLQSGAIEELTYEEAVPVPTTAVRLRGPRGDPGWTQTLLRIRSDETDSHRQSIWRGVYSARLSEARSDVARRGLEVARCARLIQGWKPGALQEVPDDACRPRGRRHRRLRMSR